MNDLLKFKEMTSEIKNSILPIYKNLLKEIPYEEVCTFSLQWGKNYPFSKNEGLLFVGKSVNGWITKEKDTLKLFDLTNPNRIFAREDQMKWVNNQSGESNLYNTRKSAFWRLIKKVAESYYPENWYSNIAWTNLYKIAPYKGGNPNSNLQKLQKKYCFELFEKEIELLSPKYVIMLTSGWELDFIDHFNSNNDMRVLGIKKWDNYQTSMVKINNVNFIISQHPQGKNEWKHCNTIVELINQNKYKNY
jgi:hypothetical protein